MIDLKEVIEFFDRLAPDWDAGMVRNEPVIARILDLGGVVPGADVLDVACGTGVLIPDYLHRGAASVTGVDISPKMAQIARGKFADDGEKINLHHSGGARHVSNGLMPAEELADLFAPFLTVDSTVSDESMYLVSGTNI